MEQKIPHVVTDQDVDDLRHAYEEVFVDLLSYDQTATAIGGVSRWTLQRLVREGRLTSVTVLGRHFITRPSIQAYIQSLVEASTRPTNSAPRRRRHTA